MKKIMNLLKNILLSKFSALIFAIISAINIIVNYSYRVSYIYIDQALFKNFSLIIFILTIISTALLVGIASINLKQKN